MNKKFSKKSGFLLVEVLVVSSILVIIVFISMSVAQKSIFVSRQSVNMTQASFLLEEGADVMRILRDQDWNNISGLDTGAIYYPVFSAGVWTLSLTPTNVDTFTRTIDIKNVSRDSLTSDISVSGNNDPNTKLINIIVSWQEGGEIITKTLSFYIMNIFS